MCVDMDEEKIWFWNQNTNELEFDFKYNGDSDLKEDLKPKVERKESKTEKKDLFQN